MVEESPAKPDESSGRRCSGRRTRRRLVQSTLFPCKRAAEEPSGAGEDGSDMAGVGEEDGIEAVGSNGAEKKRNSKSLPRAPKKASPGSKKSPRKSSNDGIYVIPAKADFFLKASEKKLQQMQQKELEGNIDSTVENGKSSRSLSFSPGKVSCWQLKESTDKINTRCKGRTSGTIGTPMGQQMAGTSLDLQSEANTAVKEDACSSGGKQLHPFFSSWKVKKTIEIIDINDQDSDCSTCALTDWPRHVYEKVEDEQSVLDWKKWMFSERTIFDLNDSLPPIDLGTSVFEGAVMPLSFDGLSTIRNVHEEKTMGPEACIEDDGQINEKGDAFNIQFTNHEDFSLWTTKYQPEKALEVCGNKESVNFLSDWLRNWQEKLPQTQKDSTKQTGTCSWSEDDSDLEDRVEDSYLKNVFLITGPVGSGKSAAIYACAKEQGFEVIEVSASDCRNGTYVKQKFGEAMESHSFNSLWKNNSMKTESAKSVELTSSQPDSMVSEEVEGDVYEVVSAISSQEAQSIFAMPKNSIERREPNKALILFEDVDTIFDEDRGLLGTIMQLAKTAKRPIILTSNRREPTLPQLLDRLEVEFKLPSIEELLSRVYMVCAAQKAFTCPKLLQLVAKSCQADIRKTLMHLQFWLQGNHDKHAQISQNLCPALQFDINAWHRVLPAILPWEFPCELAKAVEKEISNALSVVREKNLNLVNVPIISNFFCYEDDKINLRKEAMLEMNMDGNDYGEILGKKDAILRNNFFLQDYEEPSSPFDNIYNSSRSVSASPVHFFRPTTRHNPNVILSSDSEDDRSPTMLRAMSEVPMVHFQLKVSEQENNEIIEPVMNLVRSLDENISMPEDDKTIDSFTVDHSRKMVGISSSQDISCVRQSFVAETDNKYQGEYLTGTVSSGPVVFGDDALSFDLPFDGSTFYEVTVEHEKMQKEGKISRDVDFINAEEQGDSHVNDAGMGIRLCTLMDECSRVDIIPASIVLENAPRLTEVEIVDAAWGDLRGRENLKSLVTPMQKVASNISKIVNGFTNVISEADIMFTYCQPVLIDHLEQSLLPCHEPESRGWYDDQLEMCSTFAQHGFCFHAKKASFMEPSFGCQLKVDIAHEMLACSTSTMAMGKLITHEIDVASSSEQDETPDIDISLLRKQKEKLYDSILPIIPSRFLLAMRGGLHDYSSCLSQISRFENIRLSESIDGKHLRRSRTARHYLNSGSLNFAPGDVDLFAQHGCYGHRSSS